MTAARYRVVIADDHLVVREGLKLILETEEDFELVGQAQDGATAVQLAREIEPDLILMDLRMPGMGGIEAIEQIHDANPDTAVVILTTYDEDDLMV
ncbi:MAG: response regulator transcription factor, partial [Gemmatimonadales bacterium]